MRLRNVTGSAELIARSGYVCGQPEAHQGRWNSFFQNENPIHIEIGMGKGKFITEMARLHPEINYIGIERYSSVLYRAVQKLARTAKAAAVEETVGKPAQEKEDGKREYPNLTFICMDAREITKVFGTREVARIYLNFSDPWPKDRHSRRRLPSRSFLSLYGVILAKEGHLEFKTDNERLFRFALDELEPAGWRTDKVTFDLHHDPDMRAGNVMTEYEEKFAALGNPIFKYIILR